MNNVKKSIGWAGFSINPVKGLCPMHCKRPDGYEYCYAAGERGFYKRFKWNPEIRFDQTVFFQLPMKSSRVFVGSTIELFGEWVKREWLETIFRICRQHSEHTFIFLTKCPQNLIKWSPFPSNCHIGVSVTNQEMHNKAIACLSGIEASVKFISYEPLLSPIIFDSPDALSGISWVIVGQVTPVKKSTMPKIGWIQDILVACHNAGDIPPFIKENLRPLIEKEWPGWNLLQEVPVTR